MIAPVRKIVTRSGCHIRGKFPSRKMGRMVEWESTLEADVIRHFEFNPSVRAYYSQPSIEHYHDASGTAHSFVPDFRVDWRNGVSLLVEVKSDADAAYPPTKHLIGLKAMAMQLQSKSYRLLTPAVFNRQPLFGNLRLLERHARGILSPENTRYLDTLSGRTVFRVQELAQQLGSTQQVFLAIAHGVLHTNLEQPLNTESEVWHPNYQEAGDGSFQI